MATHELHAALAAIALALVACGGDELARVRTPSSALGRGHRPVRHVSPRPNAMGDGVIEAWMREEPDAFDALLADPKAVRLQVLLGEVKGDHIERHGYRVDAEYFYPASAIKLTVAVSALEALRARKAASPGAADIEPTTPLRLAETPGGSPDERDPSDLQTGRISLAQELRKMLIVSDNRAYNRLYDFVGHREANERMWRLGLASVRARSRLGDVPVGDDGRVTPEVDFLLPDGDPFVVPERKSALSLDPTSMAGIFVGDAYIDPATGARVNEPMSFAEKNRISLEDLQTLLEKVVRPDLAPPPLPSYDDADRALVADTLGTLPSESKNPSFENGQVLDDLQRPLLSGLRRVLPPARIELYSKAGRAYGFTVVNAYVVDTDTKRSFFLAATLYTNPGGTVNDDRYAYVETANGFFASLGELCARKIFGAP